MKEYPIPAVSDVITEDDPTTLEEEYEMQRIQALPEKFQPFAIEHHLNIYHALPSYVDRFKQAQEEDE